MNTIIKALNEVRISIKDIKLIAFSQSPGLGPVLKIGALVTRMLSQILNIPIVGVNHCIAHIEIGRLMCNINDPLTLYVSGGNTIVSAFESGRYQIFGETLDLAIGNMIDSFARDAGLSHPGGPKIEKLAEKSNKYLSLPYVVKGMDLSFSGIYTAAKRLIESEDFNKKYNLNDVANSIQETTFAMLTEVTERALAHTEKTEVLLTGGVAANKRLQKMIEYISKEHNARFKVVPLKYAGDNGAMIGWTGILRYNSVGGHDISETIINPKERMDQITVPWRD
jgi:N6-L-threonylcarbamoyladenine synthase/protein kinase Bud32